MPVRMIVTYEVIFIIARTTTIMVDMCHMVIIIETTMVIHVILTYSVMRIDDESTQNQGFDPITNPQTLWSRYQA